MSMNTKPLVSICTMTKDLEGLIADGIKSWLAQQTTFPFEIVLSDDCSTDNTLEVVRKFQQEYPEKIKVLTAEKRLGLSKNWIKCMQACQGKYIAFCDGDDLWTDPFKLQKQIDYMEANPDCNMVCSDYDYISETGVFIESEWKKDWYGKKFDIVENLAQSICTTLTTVIRTSALAPLIYAEKHPFIWDTVLWAYTLKEGYGYFYPEKMALRRVQENGEYTTKGPLERAVYDIASIEAIKSLIKDKRVQQHLDESLYMLNIMIAKENFKKGNKQTGRKHLLQSAFAWQGTPAIKHNVKYVYWYLKSLAQKSL
ncbi:MAG TPA: glycosyltransferase [Flavisolibacter sp.]|nr:glycosyltransferase [Flavisolibacter sp.]